MENIKTLKDFDFKDKRVLIRTDYNVPIDSNGKITNSKRIIDSVKTIKYLLKNNVKQITIITHFGRPKNRDEKLKTDVIAKKLTEILNINVKKLNSWEKNENEDSKIVMYENLRFNDFEKHEDEEKRDEFAKLLIKGNDIFVMEAFSNMHRKKEASMSSIIKFIPSCIGFLVEREISTINNALNHPKRPYIAIIGGLKGDKIDSIENIMQYADKIIVGGTLGFLFNHVMGINIGKTKIDYEKINKAKELIKNDFDNKLVLPVDCVIADSFSNDSNFREVNIDNIDDDFMALDIGRKTIKLYCDLLSNSKTITWNGPIGVFEFENFSNGTKKISESIVDATKNNAITIIGGGDSAAAIELFNYQDKVSFVSSGGGASLMMFERKELPILKLLKKYSNN